MGPFRATSCRKHVSLAWMAVEGLPAGITPQDYPPLPPGLSIVAAPAGSPIKSHVVGQKRPESYIQ